MSNRTVSKICQSCFAQNLCDRDTFNDETKNKKKYKALLCAVFASYFMCLVAGCTLSKQITGPNGETLYSIDCSGALNNMGSCLEKAGKICGASGYDIVMGDTKNQGPLFSGSEFGFFGGPLVSREILIHCKDAPQKSSSPSKGVRKP